MLHLVNVSVSYRQSTVVKNINLNVAAGSVTVLLGANGAGKTTVLRAVCNMLVRTSGDIMLLGKRINRMPTEKIARLGVAHVPDGRGTFLQLSVDENLRLGAYFRPDKMQVREDRDRMFEYFPRLGERLAQTAGTLSGGEQQMLAIARALMSRPTLLLLDEPSFGLAPLVVSEIFQILNSIRQRDQITILLVEQNAELALAFADYGYVLETGEIVLHGAGADLARNESIRRVYLGI